MDFQISVLLLIIGTTLTLGPVLAVIALIRLARLERRLGEVSRRLDSAVGAGTKVAAPGAEPARPVTTRPPESPPLAPSTGAPAFTTPTEAGVAATPPSEAAAITTTPAGSRTRGLDIESMIAGRWLNRVGIVALLFAVGFFLKYAFDNEWVGPGGRVAIGLLAGAALLVYSQWLLGRGYRYFSEGIAGLGGGVLYLSVYAAWSFYHLIPQPLAFGGMVVVTAALVALALGRDSERLAFLALMGGFMTPLLLRTGRDPLIVLFSYIAVLDAALLALTRLRRWRSIEPLALLWTVFYFASWYNRFYTAGKLWPTLFFATLFFVMFAALPVLRSRHGAALRPERLALVLANSAWFMIALHLMLYREHRWGLTLAVLALAAFHLGVVRLLPREASGDPSPARLLFAGLALTFVTLAIPIRLEGKWITMAWAIEGAVLVWSGFRSGLRLLRGAGLVLFLLVGLLLLSDPIDGGRLLLNARFATFAVVVVCLALAVRFATRAGERLSKIERALFGGLGVVTHLLAVWALSMEVWDFLARGRFGLEAGLSQQLGLSLLWTLCATALIVAGVRLASTGLRWQGLALMGLAVGKVFLHDLSFLQRGYRILSLMVLGGLLLLVSFIYQRKLAGGDPGEQP